MAKPKINEAGLRVLELLKVVANRPVSSAALLTILENKTENIYRKEVINKYLNTLKLVGLNVEKIKGKYVLLDSIEKTDFCEKDLALILFLKDYIKKLHNETFKDNFYEAFQILERTFSTKTKNLIKSKTIKPYVPGQNVVLKDENVKKYEKYCKELLKTIILYKEDSTASAKSYTVSPLKVVYKKGKAVFVGYCNEESDYKEFIIDNILESKQTPQKSASNYPSSVTFKLKGRLKDSYVLKEEEKIIQYGSDFIVVSNKIEDRTLLVKRLLRYYDKCEILYPKECRQKMVRLIEEMEDIYA